MRRESNTTRDLVELDALWQASVSDTDPTPPVTLQGGVTSMGVRVWQNNAWREQPDLAPQGGLPATPVTGLQVVLAARSFPQPLTKSFLLGST
jgi:general secretion pathway protein J